MLVACSNLNGMILLLHLSLYISFAGQEISLVRFSKAGPVFILRKYYYWHLKFSAHGEKNQIQEIFWHQTWHEHKRD